MNSLWQEAFKKNHLFTVIVPVCVTVPNSPVPLQQFMLWDGDGTPCACCFFSRLRWLNEHEDFWYSTCYIGSPGLAWAGCCVLGSD